MGLQRDTDDDHDDNFGDDDDDDDDDDANVSVSYTAPKPSFSLVETMCVFFLFSFMPQEFRSKLTKAADQREDEARGLCFGWLVGGLKAGY